MDKVSAEEGVMVNVAVTVVIAMTEDDKIAMVT